MQQLNEYFLLEVFKSSLTSKTFLEIIKPHLDYSFLPHASYKHIFKCLFEYYDIHGNTPTLGQVAQTFSDKPEINSLLSKVKDVNISDKKDALLVTMETFIKRAKFVKLHVQTKELYEKGRQEDAMKLLEEKSEGINSFSLRTKLYTEIFSGFKQRMDERKNRDFSEKKVPTGIPAFDFHTDGGVERGTSLLITARSGIGKTTCLRWLGFSAALRGHNVVHFQGEGTKEEVEDAFDAMWTGIEVRQIKRGTLNGVNMKELEESLEELKRQCGKIYVVAWEQFDTATISDCRGHLIDLLKNNDISLGVFDYMEEFDPGDGKTYRTDDKGERLRRKATAKKIINISTEFNIATATATQAMNIPFAKWNDPNYVITREEISEAKPVINPFAYHVTLNQTHDEDDNSVLRIYEDKLRHYKVKSTDRVYKVAQARDVGRFIDVQRTLDEFYDSKNNRIIFS